MFGPVVSEHWPYDGKFKRLGVALHSLPQFFQGSPVYGYEGRSPSTHITKLGPMHLYAKRQMPPELQRWMTFAERNRPTDAMRVVSDYAKPMEYKYRSSLEAVVRMNQQSGELELVKAPPAAEPQWVVLTEDEHGERLYGWIEPPMSPLLTQESYYYGE